MILTPAIREIITTSAKRHGVPVSLALAQAHHESGFDPRIVSRKGAVGLFQLMPVNQTGIDPENPIQNADRGMQIMHTHKRRFGTWNKALIAYVWGPGNLSSHKPVPVAARTYVQVIRTLQGKYGVFPSTGLLGAVGASLALWWFLRKQTA